MRFLTALFLFSLLGLTELYADSLEGQAAIDAGAESFTSHTDAPWYDAQTDSVDPLKLEPLKKPPTSTSTGQKADLSWLYQIFQILGWTVLGLIVAAIIFMMIRANTQGNALNQMPQTTTQQPIDPDRVEELPFTLAKPKGDLYSTAEQYYRDGDFANAIIYLYSHMLLKLDQAQVIRLSRGKTNRQYLRETKRGSAAGPILEQTIIAFEDVFFGHHELTRARFEACWQALPQFESLLQQSPSEAGLVLA